MSKLFVFTLVVSATAIAQTKDVYEVIGFPPPSEKEFQTLYEETYFSMKKSADCRRQFIQSYGGRGGPSVQTEADTYCGGTGLIDAKQRSIEDNYRAFLGTFADSRLASYGVDGAQSTMFNYYQAKPYQGNPTGMSCWSQGAPGAEYQGQSGEFIDAHRALVNAESLGQKSASYLKKMEKAAKDACKAFSSNTNNRGPFSNVEISAGFDGNNIVRTVKDVSSIAEALPLIHFSTVRNFELGTSYVGSNAGSSNGGADAVMKELEHDLMERYYQAYDGNRFTDFHNRATPNPFVRMRGANEGNEKKWNEADNLGSAGVIFWDICIVQKPNETKPSDPEESPIDGNGKDKKSINLMNENVEIELPDNLVSPFPLTVVDGKITGVDITMTEKQGMMIPNLSGPVYAYGPRNSALKPHDKTIMITGATAMNNKAKNFVEQLLDNPGETVNLEKSSLVIASCSNQLRNQPGYKVWKTNAAPEARGSDDRISFEELSTQRSDAQYIVVTSLIQKELDAKKVKLEEERKKLVAQKVKAPQGSALQAQLDNRISYLDNQLKKISQMDVKKIKKNVVNCDAGGEKGVGGPNPYYKADNKLGKKWPKKTGSESAYWSEVAAVSKEIKTADVQEKLIATKKALSELIDAPEAKVQAEVYKDWIKKYESILAGKDGKPGYLNIPLLKQDKNYPCDLNQPGVNITCDIVADTSKALDGFKVEKFMADVQMDKTEVPKGIEDGWKNEKPQAPALGGAKIFYAGALCTRKYQEPNNPTRKGKKCISKTTGWEIDCPPSGSGNAKGM
jgi:hypothetical protein